jgi:outer membrane protein assembly factor BamA
MTRILLIFILTLYLKALSAAELLFIPVISASSESHFNIGGSLYSFNLLDKSDVSYIYVNASTAGDIYTSLSSFDNKFFDIFSYQLFLSYGNIGDVRYYGAGITGSSRVSDISLKSFNSLVTLGLNITDYLNIGLGFVINNTRTYSGRNVQGVGETFFTYPDESGLYRNSFSIARRIYARFDTRDSTVAPTTGELLEFDLDRSDGTLNSKLIFTRYALNAQKIIPVMDSLYFVPRFNWESIIGDNLPFYSLAGIGGSSKLRAFANYRFVDNHAMLFGTELRYHFLTSEHSWYKFFEIAAFVDAGNIAGSVSGFAMDNLQYCFGGGFRLNISPGVILRFDYATNTREHFFYIQQGYPF